MIDINENQWNWSDEESVLDLRQLTIDEIEFDDGVIELSRDELKSLFKRAGITYGQY